MESKSESVDYKSFPTGAHIKKEDLRLQEGVRIAIEEMRLRKWAVEAAIDLSKYSQGITDVTALTHFFYNFVTNQENADETA